MDWPVCKLQVCNLVFNKCISKNHKKKKKKKFVKKINHVFFWWFQCHECIIEIILVSFHDNIRSKQAATFLKLKIVKRVRTQQFYKYSKVI